MLLIIAAIIFILVIGACFCASPVKGIGAILVCFGIVALTSSPVLALGAIVLGGLMLLGG